MQRDVRETVMKYVFLISALISVYSGNSRENHRSLSPLY